MSSAVIYARYSTDMQSDASIEDQIRLCKERAQKDGHIVGQVYTDHAMSGASMMRPGIQMLMQEAAIGKFDVVYAEALDRISRDQEDIAGIFKRLSFADIEIVTLAEGDISPLHIGLKGTMNALFLKDLAEKTRRGLRGRIELGRSGGGKAYGYRVVRKDEERGLRAIDETEADVVRRIFEDYARGVSPKAIAARLNKEGIPGPAGRGWGQSTINGNRARGAGILNNELYIGRLIWNRLRYPKDPVTGKRSSRLNPESEWIIQEVPELRIIDDGLWERVKARQGELKENRRQQFWTKQRPRKLFSGLIKCGCCGGGYSMVSQTQLGCSNSRNKGTCSNRKTINREKLERDILSTLQTHLMDPQLCEEFCQEYTKHMNKLRMEHNAESEARKREHARIKSQLGQMVDAIADGAPVAPIRDRMHALEDRRVELERLMEDFVEAPPLLHPNMALRYRDQVNSLIEALREPAHRAEVTDIIRSLVEKVVLTPHESENRLVADLHGDLAGILAMSVSTKGGRAIDADALARHRATLGLIEAATFGMDSAQRIKLVAGAGFEPATFRL